MKVKVISDSHNDHLDITDSLECDILVHCGDFSTKGNYTEVRAFLSWFVKQPAKYKIIVPGNHDRKMKSNSELLSLAKEYGISVLMNEGLEINGRKIWGGHFVPYIRNGSFNSDLATRASAWKDMPKELDLLITHAPPQFILDTNKEGEHCGCDQLMYAVIDRDIKKHVFGHIHEDGGKTMEYYNTTFYNCAVKDRSYLTVRSYREIEI